MEGKNNNVDYGMGPNITSGCVEGDCLKSFVRKVLLTSPSPLRPRLCSLDFRDDELRLNYHDWGLPYPESVRLLTSTGKPIKVWNTEYLRKARLYFKELARFSENGYEIVLIEYLAPEDVWQSLRAGAGGINIHTFRSIEHKCMFNIDEGELQIKRF